MSNSPLQITITDSKDIIHRAKSKLSVVDTLLQISYSSDYTIKLQNPTMADGLHYLLDDIVNDLDCAHSHLSEVKP